MSGPRIPIRSPRETALQWCVEDLLAEPLAVGAGSAVVMSGWCFHRESAIRQLRLKCTRGTARAAAHSLPRPDVFDVLRREDDPNPHSYASGFYVVLPLSGAEAEEIVDLFMEVELADGRRVTEGVGRLPLARALPVEPHPALAGSPVVICMATYDPDYELFSRQIESIVNQSETGWRCLISDDHSAPDRFDRLSRALGGDDRFTIERNPVRKGTYRNFEHALSRVNPDAAYVALADQDDHWYPDKLATLIDALRPGALLAYSDSRIRRPDGSLIGETFFPHRRNNWQNLRQLVMANTVTGAASLFRRELLDDALPFPPEIELSYHDHWLALVALSLGELAYIDRPLYDYIQHSENLLGHSGGQRLAGLGTRFPWMVRNRLVYQYDILRVSMLATVLEQRISGRIAPGKRRELRRLRSLDGSPIAAAGLLFQAPAARATSTTLGLERDLLAGLTWRQLMSRAGRTKKHLWDNRYSAEFQRSPHRSAKPEQFGHVAQLSLASTPLRLVVDRETPTRTNLLLPQAQSAPPTPEHLVELQLALRLAGAAQQVRIVICEPQEPSSPDWRDWFLADERSASAEIELVDAADRSQPLPVSPEDSFIATNWSTALVAHAAAKQLGATPFVYLIQEYAPSAVASGSLASAAEDSYRQPHHALFSSEPLLEYFRTHRLGRFAERTPSHGTEAISFCIPVTAMARPDSAVLGARSRRRMLVYAPPEDLTSMFDTALIALGRVARSGALNDWELNAFGRAGVEPSVELAAGVVLVGLGAFSPRRYAEVLASHDVGVSLLAASRPDPVALDMACAGMVTVTNTQGAARHDRLAQRSSNLIAVEGTVEAIEAGIAEAIARADDVTARREAATLSWPSRWADAFDEGTFQRLLDWLAPAGSLSRRQTGSAKTQLLE